MGIRLWGYLGAAPLFLLLMRDRGKQDWLDDDVQIRLEAEVRRLQENTGGRFTTNSLSPQRMHVLSNTEGRISLQHFYLSHFHSFCIVCLVGLLLATRPYYPCHTPGKEDTTGVLGPHWVIFHMGLSFRVSVTRLLTFTPLVGSACVSLSSGCCAS